MSLRPRNVLPKKKAAIAAKPIIVATMKYPSASFPDDHGERLDPSIMPDTAIAKAINARKIAIFR
jgi:hypothetical protein